MKNPTTIIMTGSASFVGGVLILQKDPAARGLGSFFTQLFVGTVPPDFTSMMN